MRVAIDARAIGPYFPGIGRATLGLLHGLSMLDHETQVVVLHQPEHVEYIKRSGTLGDPRFTFKPWPISPFDMRQHLQAPRLARQLDVDVWHAPYYMRPLWGLPPTVVTVFDAIGPDSGTASVSAWSALRHANKQIAWRLALRLSIQRASQIITSSYASKAALQPIIGTLSHSIQVVPLAVDEAFQPQMPSLIAAVRASYALPTNYVLYLGSNKPHKNLDALLLAWYQLLGDARLSEIIGETQLVVAGREYARYYSTRTLCIQLGLESRVRFLPDVQETDLPALLSGGTCFVFPSLQEGFGLPPLEAMACGSPVIASNRTSLPEVVGNAGLLVDPVPSALASGLAQLLTSPALREELRQRGLAQAAKFSWQRTAMETLGIYQRLAGRSGSCDKGTAAV